MGVSAIEKARRELVPELSAAFPRLAWYYWPIDDSYIGHDPELVTRGLVGVWPHPDGGWYATAAEGVEDDDGYMPAPSRTAVEAVHALDRQLREPAEWADQWLYSTQAPAPKKETP